MAKQKEKETRLDRAKKQRMFYMGRTASADETWSFLVTGSSGKVYTVTIMKYADSSGRTIKCNCMDHIMRRKNCKHILFLSMRVLKLSTSRVEELATGKAIDSEELSEIAANAGGDVAHEFAAPKYMKQYLQSLVGDRLEGGQKQEEVERREPEDGDDCPICFENLTDGALVYCRYGCGKAIHKECFDMWAKSKVGEGGGVTCVYCRTKWSADSTSSGGVGCRGLLHHGHLINVSVQKARVTKKKPAMRRKATKKGDTSKTVKPTKEKKTTAAKTSDKTTRKSSKKAQKSSEKPSKATSQYVEPKGTRKSSRIASKRGAHTKENTK